LTWELKVGAIAALIGIPVALFSLADSGLGLWDRLTKSDEQIAQAPPRVPQAGRFPTFKGSAGHFEKSRKLVRFLLAHDGEVVRLNAYLGIIGRTDLRLRNGHVDWVVLWERCDGTRPPDPGAVDPAGSPWACWGTRINQQPGSPDSSMYYEAGVRIVGYFAVSAPGGYRMSLQQVAVKPLSVAQALRAVG
jgi:hypothetical protein